MIDTDRLISQLDRLYGKGKGAVVCMTILPPILADFQKILSSSAPGTIVSEDYLLDDGKGTIALSGSRTVSGKTDIRADLT